MSKSIDYLKTRKEILVKEIVNIDKALSNLIRKSDLEFAQTCIGKYYRRDYNGCKYLILINGIFIDKDRIYVEGKEYSYFVFNTIDKRIYQNDKTCFTVEDIKENYKEISKEEYVSSVIEILDRMKLSLRDD